MASCALAPPPRRTVCAAALQGLWVYLVGLPAYLLNTRSALPPPLTVVDALGLAVWALGLSVQAVADSQKSAFRKITQNRDAYIDTGLWAISRHPNYLGEITLHSGLALVAANGLPAGERTLAIVPPLFTAMLLLFVSGVPPLEKHASAKWGHLPAYREYVARTGILVPYPSSLLGARTRKQKAK